MATNLHTIVLKGNGHHDEGEADGVISPGMAITLAADGKYDQTVLAQVAALKGGLLIAEEAALQGKTVDDAYAAGDRVFFYIPQPGDHIHALVKLGEDIGVGDNLVVVGGTSGLFEEVAGSEARFQLEALEGPGTLAATTLVRCRVL